jgi:hypothetical protein
MVLFLSLLSHVEQEILERILSPSIYDRHIRQEMEIFSIKRRTKLKAVEPICKSKEKKTFYLENLVRSDC